MPVDALWGVGPATANKLRRLGLGFVRDLARVDEAALRAHVGPRWRRSSWATPTARTAARWESDRRAKSLGHEQTFAVSLVGWPR